eukprot:TRINITY_DN1579_c0_g1_i3.p1 TRINITY_DN1579_c0_g1~~TRINITY_DN1579_c0_g1_i3.p1  ORF type:complete len:355 (-),score=121.25 TRINITY_DN1579_c0_g1_i3:381-1445(-)
MCIRDRQSTWGRQRKYTSNMVDNEPRQVYTFSAGPSILPLPVLKKAQEEFLSYNKIGVSLLEMSHRSKEFETLIKKAETDLREILNVPANYKVLFLQGGASTQFACIPLNLLRGKQTANYLVTGQWGIKAVEEARKYCKVNLVTDLQKGQKFVSVPDPSTWKIDENGAYFHYTDNETIDGVEFADIPQLKNQILVCDMSSNFLSRPVDVSKFGMIYAGAQKNFGPAGMTLVIIREDLLGGAIPSTPTMLNLKIHADNASLYNTAPTFSIYIAGLYFDYIKKTGGLGFWRDHNTKKAQLIYDVVDASNGFYLNNIDKRYRSKMNIVFRIRNGMLTLTISGPKPICRRQTRRSIRC